MLWAYFSFSQFLIIWARQPAGRDPVVPAADPRRWGYVALLLVFGHFVLPFLLLLSRNLKERASLLAKVAIGDADHAAAST